MAPTSDAQRFIDQQTLFRRQTYGQQVSLNDTRQDLPGVKLGATLEQHLAALRLAGQQDPQPRPFKDEKQLISEVDAVVAATKGKSDAAAMRNLLSLNLALEQQLAAQQQQQQQQQQEQQQQQLHVDAAQVDLQQRRLADNLPSSTSLRGGSSDAARVQLFKCRCAVAKGKHEVEYEGFPAAAQLLRLLAEQNSPAVKVVLQLPPLPPPPPPPKDSDEAGSSGGKTEGGKAGGGSSKAGGSKSEASKSDVSKAEASKVEAKPVRKATASDRSCGGAFVASFDVRGRYLPPQCLDPLPDNKGNVYEQLARLELQLGKHTDTAGLEVEPEGSGPAAALELCYKVMAQMREDGRSACVVVQWAPQQQQQQQRRLHVVLAETDASRKGMLLLCTPEVLEGARRDAAAGASGEQPQRTPLVQRFDRILEATQAILDCARPGVEHAAFEGQMAYLVQQKVQEHGAIWMPRTMFDVDGSDSDE